MAFEVAARTGKKGRARPDMNVTPLVDVVLVLLIIFMVITPMLAKQFWIHLPNPETRVEPATSRPEEGVVVTVDAVGKIRINRDEVSEGEFEVRLRSILSTRTDRTIVFDAAGDAPYGRAVAILDRARGGGASTIAVSTRALTD